MGVLDKSESFLRKAAPFLSAAAAGMSPQYAQSLAQQRQLETKLSVDEKNRQRQQELDAAKTSLKIFEDTLKSTPLEDKDRKELERGFDELASELNISVRGSQILPSTKREIRNDPNGVPRYVGSGDPVFPDVNPSGFQPEMVPIEGLPEGYQAVRTGKNSVKIIAPNKGSVNYWTEPDDEGNLAILKEDDNGITVEGYVQQDGKKFKTYQSTRQEMINERENQRQTGANNRAALRQENVIIDDIKPRLKPLDELDLNIKKAKTVLDTDDLSGLDAKALRNTLSQIFNTDVRAQAELQSFANYGDLLERASGLISGLVAGKPTKAQVDMAKSIISRFERMVEQGKLEIYEQATKRAEVQSEGRNLDIRPGAFVPEQKSGELTPEEQEELRALEEKFKVGNNGR